MGWAIFFLIFIQTLLADTSIDSLTQLINQSQGTKKVQLTLQLADTLVLRSRSDAIPVYHRAVNLSRKTGDKTTISEALYKTGNNYYFLGYPDSAAAYFNESLQLAKDVSDSIQIGKALLRLGNTSILQNEQDLAERYFLNALSVIQKLNDPVITGRTLNNLANLYGQWGQYTDALHMYDQAQEYYEKAGYTEGLGWLNFSIARLYKQISDYDNALKHSQIALEYYDSLLPGNNDSTGVSICYGQLGDIYIQKRDFDKALEYHRIALRLREKFGVKSAIADSYRGLGEIYYYQKDFDKAMDYFQQAIDLRRDMRTTTGTATLMKYIGLIYLEKGDTRKARNYLKGALSLARKGKQQLLQKELLEKITGIYLGWKDFENSKKYFNEYQALSDSVFNFEVSNKITSYLLNSEFEKYQQEKKLLTTEKRIAELELEREHDVRRQLLILLVSALIILLATLVVYRQKFRDNKRLKKKHDEVNAAHRKLKQEIEERKKIEKEREALIVELKESLSQIKTLSGLIPICAHCKKIRNDEGYYEQLEKYIMDHSDAVFSHGICPDCMQKLYPDIIKKMNDESETD